VIAGLDVNGPVAAGGLDELLVNAVGQHTDWSIVVILAALFFGFYLMRINYAFTRALLNE